VSLGADWRRPRTRHRRPAKALLTGRGPTSAFLFGRAVAEPECTRRGRRRRLATWSSERGSRRIVDDKCVRPPIAGLSKTARHEADAVYIAALAAKDFQLVMTAAAALRGFAEP